MSKAVTIFSGVGSSSLALRNLGMRVLAHDIMPEACRTLRANGFLADQISVTDIDWSEPRYSGTRILVGGPPCQPFSQAHAGDGQYDPRDMIPEFVRAVSELQPEVFVMEEVQTLMWKKHIPYLAKVIGDLAGCGYRVDQRVLDASAVTHVGQARKRLFIVGIRDDLDRSVTWPAEIPKAERTTMAEALGWDERTCWSRNEQAPAPAIVSEVNCAAALWPLDRPSTTVVGSFRPEVQAAPGYRKPGDGPRQNALGSVVTTFEERLKLQGLPTNWVVEGSQSKRDLQVGNSCPTPLLEALIGANL